MRRKAQVGIVSMFFLYLVFLILYFVWLGGFLADIGHGVTVSQRLTGIEAFSFDHLNILVLVVSFIGMIGYSYFGGPA